MPAVTREHAEKVCKFGQGEGTCAFLALSDGFECTKGTGAEITIRDRLAEGSMKAKGDNCGGAGVDPNSCKALCENSGVMCSMCFQGDMANCRFDPDINDKTDCKKRCTKPEGPCAEGETMYEKLGYHFEA